MSRSRLGVSLYGDGLMLMLSPKAIGAIGGLVFGIIVVTVGFAEAFLVALFVAIGWLIGKFWMGEIDLIDLHERFIRGRGRERRR